MSIAFKEYRPEAPIPRPTFKFAVGDAVCLTAAAAKNRKGEMVMWYGIVKEIDDTHAKILWTTHLFVGEDHAIHVTKLWTESVENLIRTEKPR